MIKTQRSIVDPVALGDVVAAAYQADVQHVVLLRSLVNDVYRVDTADGPRVAKLYRAGHHTLEDVSWEVELSLALDGTVARGVPLADGRLAGSVAAAEGERPLTLWEWAPGGPPTQPFGDELFRRYGAGAGRFHAACDWITIRPRRFSVMAALDRPYQEVLERLGNDDRARLAELIDAAQERMTGADLDTGVCHGDLSLDNLHLDRDRVIFYDLDRAGNGWRATDLTGVAATDHYDAFLDGYRSVRPLRDEDLAAVPWLDAVVRVSNLHFHLIDKPALRGTESLGEGWLQENLDALRSAAATLLR